MTDAGPAESPLEAAAGAAGGHTTEAFELLANETRLAVLLALWEADEPGPGDDSLTFSELYDRVDYGDPGNFSYHLEKLEGQFVSKVDDGEGYELLRTGLKLVRAVIAGAGLRDARLDRTEIDKDCWFCGAPTAVFYRDGALHQVCTECEGNATGSGTPDGWLNSMQLHPAALTDRSAEDLLAAAGVAAYRHIRTMAEGLCSACSGPIDAALDVCADHDPDGTCDNCGFKQAAWTRFECRVCKDSHTTTPTVLALFHPAVVHFYYDHGVSLHWHADEFDTVSRVIDLYTAHEMEVVATDPSRVDVSVPLDGDELRVTFDETASVVDVNE